MKAVNDDVISTLLADPAYDVRDDGTVWSRKAAGEWRQIGFAFTGRSAYLAIKYRARVLLIHRIIYAKFTGPLRADLEINHLDGNKKNNRPSNLELVTGSQNVLHDYRVLNRAPSLSNAKLSPQTVEQIRKDYLPGVTQQSLALRYGVDQSTVSHIVNGRTWRKTPNCA